MARSEWRTVRVFLASTFKDMEAERDHLVRFVFPRLREALLSRRVHLVDVDLRWGVTSEQDAIDICRSEIDRCRPRIVGLLGGRYGWVPPPPSISADAMARVLAGETLAGHPTDVERALFASLYEHDADTGDFRARRRPTSADALSEWESGWSVLIDLLRRAAHPDVERSITASELQYGALEQLDEVAFRFFYFRDERVTESIPAPYDAHYRETGDSVAARHLAGLKDRIRRSVGRTRDASSAVVVAPLPVYEYPCAWSEVSARIVELHAFGDRVYADLLASVDAELGAASSAPAGEFDDVDAATEAVTASHEEHFVLGSRAALVAELHDHARARNGSGYLCVVGEPGTGKSALLARLYRGLTDEPPGDAVVLAHFAGFGAGSTDVRAVMRRLCHVLAPAVGESAAPPDDHEELRLTFVGLLARAAEQCGVIVLLDALDRLDRAAPGGATGWLPEVLPHGARFLLSAVSGPAVDALVRRVGPAMVRHLDALTDADAGEVVDRFLMRYRKSLEPEQRAALLLKPHARRPLYLRAALEELRTVGVADITGWLGALPGETRTLFEWILERLEGDHVLADRSGRQIGASIVPQYCVLLAVSRAGLEELEVRELVAPAEPGPGERPDPLGNVGALQRLLRPYFILRGRLLDFAHEQLREAVCARYLDSPSAPPTARRDAHRLLADYFQSRDQASHRKLSELGFHLHQLARAGGGCARLFALVEDDRFRQAQFEVLGRADALVANVDLAVDAARAEERVHEVVRYALLRDELLHRLFESYMYRLVEIARVEPARARGIAALIPDPRLRRMEFLLLAWLQRRRYRDDASVGELVAAARGIGPIAKLSQTPALLELVRALYEEGVPEAAEVLVAVPRCPVADAYQEAWSLGPMPSRMLAARLAESAAYRAAPTDDEQEAFTQMLAFTRRRSRETLEWFGKGGADAQIARHFGHRGLPDVYFLLASHEIQAGSDRLAEELVNRAVSVGSTIPRPSIRSLRALTDAFRSAGEPDLADEEASRAEAERFYLQSTIRTPDERARLEDALDTADDGPDSRALAWHAEVVDAPPRDILGRLSQARQWLARDQNDAACHAIWEAFHRVRTATPVGSWYRLPVLVAMYSIARVRGDDSMAEESVAALREERTDPAVDVTQLFATHDVDGRRAALDGVVVTTDPRCVATVATAFRLTDRLDRLLDLLIAASRSAAHIDAADAIVAEMVRLPGRPTEELRRIAEQVRSKVVAVASGLGMYFYPATMLSTLWPGVVLAGLGVAAARATPVARTAGLVMAGAALLGGLADLAAWHALDVATRPERSRHMLRANPGSTLAGVVALLVAQRWLHPLPGRGPLALGVAVAGALVVVCIATFRARGVQFAPLSRRFVLGGSALAIAAGAVGTALTLWAAGPAATRLFAGFFVGGMASLGIALGIAPKHLVLARRYRGARDPERDRFQFFEPHPTPKRRALSPTERMLADARRTARRDPRRAEALLSRVIDDRERASVDGLSLASTLLNRGFIRRALGRPADALADYARAAELNPRSCRPHLNAGIVYGQDLGDYDLSTAAFDRALSLCPTSVDALSSRGLAKAARGDLAAAERDLRAALAIEPGFADALHNLGSILTQAGRHDEAAQAFRAAHAADRLAPTIRQ